MSLTCPEDKVANDGVVCRPQGKSHYNSIKILILFFNFIAGPCDVADTCDGVTSNCSDVRARDSFVCRESVSICDIPEVNQTFKYF